MKEQDLYPPVKNLFESMGYDVHAEVNSIDVVAKLDRTVIAIELKKEFSLALITQGAKRHKLTDFCYLAIPKPTSKVQKGGVFKDKLYLLKRLGLGLIFVDTKKAPYTAKIVHEPALTDIKAQQASNKRKRTALLRELRERHSNFNIGGTKGKIITAYRENVLDILRHFSDDENHTTKEIIENTGNKKATRILYTDHYGWFVKEGRGEYHISDKGKTALNEYSHVINEITARGNS